MSTGTLAKVSAKTAAEVCKKCELEEPAQELLTKQHSPQEFLNLLIEKEMLDDACRFLAHALPKREAIWWAWQCAKDVPTKKEPQAVALQLTEKWVIEPTDDHQRPAMDSAEAAGFGTPAGSCALAVAFSGGSLTPPDLPPVAPAEHLTGGAVTTAVRLAALLPDPMKAPARLKEYLNLGIEVAKGASRWKDVPAAVPLPMAKTPTPVPGKIPTPAPPPRNAPPPPPRTPRPPGR